MTWPPLAGQGRESGQSGRDRHDRDWRGRHGRSGPRRGGIGPRSRDIRPATEGTCATDATDADSDSVAGAGVDGTEADSIAGIKPGYNPVEMVLDLVAGVGKGHMVVIGVLCKGKNREIGVK